MKVEDIRKVAIVGAGLMGHGIAQEFALAGYEVGLHDTSDEKLQRALTGIETNFTMLMEIGSVSREQVDSALRNIHPGTVLDDVVADADVVIEAVFENLELKQEIFRRLDLTCAQRTILASNTSTLLPGMLASATRRPDRVLVTHYFNPPYLLPLVKIVRHKGTSDATVATIHDLLVRVGKSPAIVQKEVPGFIGNRLQMALFREALSIVEQGIATPQDVDTVVKNGFGRRYAAAGPFEIWEIAGWDLIAAIAQYLLPDLESSTEISAFAEGKKRERRAGCEDRKGLL